MTVTPPGGPTDPLSAPSLSAWASQVTAAVNAAPPPGYWFVKTSGHLNIGDTFQQLATLTAPALDPGVYEIGWSITWALQSTVQSAEFRVWYNGFASTYIAEPRDRSDIVPMVYLFPDDHAGGDYLTFEAAKEAGADPFDVDYCDLWIQRRS